MNFAHPATDMAARDKILFTPGPLTTSRTVKQAMLRDFGSRDTAFIAVVRDVCNRLVALCGPGCDAYEAIPMQGSGTFSVESVLTSTVPPDGKVLVLVNGAYGRRMVQICRVAGIAVSALEYAEDETPSPDDLRKALADDPSVTMVAVVHCETTSGLINPIAELGQVVCEAGKVYFVDAMSSFGAVPVSLAECGIDFLVSSANKCIEGVPGFGFVLARREALLATKGCARSLSLDLHSQWEGLESNGQFRFTPPTHALLAFHQALLELEQEGGVENRSDRYRANHYTLVTGMRAMGFREYLAPERQGFIITSFHYPKTPLFDFETFYRRLNDKGYVIYPGKVGKADCFRIGSIGRLYPADINALLAGIAETLREMGVSLPLAD